MRQRLHPHAPEAAPRCARRYRHPHVLEAASLCARGCNLVCQRPATLRQALHWFMRAASQGLALGQTQVGFSFYLGEGVEKNETEAARWFGLAAAQARTYVRTYLRT